MITTNLPTRMLATLLLVIGLLTALAAPANSATATQHGQSSHAASLITAPTGGGRAPLDETKAGRLADRTGATLVDIATRKNGREAFGTGIVLTPDGLVLTNHHVIAQADTLRAASLGNGRTYRVSVIGTDPDHDVALIQLRGATGLPTANLGDSDRVRIGDQVLTLGNADGQLGGRLTYGTGPVTGLRQTIDSTTHRTARLRGLIEADAGVLPGDSGGAMINARGEVIGMTVAYLSAPDDDRPSGVGYAIPINKALRVAAEIMATSPSLT